MTKSKLANHVWNLKKEGKTNQLFPPLCRTWNSLEMVLSTPNGFSINAGIIYKLSVSIIGFIVPYKLFLSVPISLSFIRYKSEHLQPKK